MISARRLLAVGSVLLAVACGRAEEPAPARRRAVLDQSPLPAAPAAGPPSPYDGEGRLVPGEEPLAGVALPRGARVLGRRSEGARATLEAVPFDKVVDFYGRYLQTGQIEHGARGVRFVHAVPRVPGSPRARVEVVLQRGARTTAIAIFDESPTGARAPRGGDAAVRKALGFEGPVDFARRVKGVTE